MSELFLERQHIELKKDISRQKIGWEKEKQLMLQKIEQLETKLQDCNERENRLKDSNQGLVHTLSRLKEENGGISNTQNMIKDLSQEVKLLKIGTMSEFPHSIYDRNSDIEKSPMLEANRLMSRQFTGPIKESSFDSKNPLDFKSNNPYISQLKQTKSQIIVPTESFGNAQSVESGSGQPEFKCRKEGNGIGLQSEGALKQNLEGSAVMKNSAVYNSGPSIPSEYKELNQSSSPEGCPNDSFNAQYHKQSGSYIHNSDLQNMEELENEDCESNETSKTGRKPGHFTEGQINRKAQEHSWNPKNIKMQVIPPDSDFQTKEHAFRSHKNSEEMEGYYVPHHKQGSYSRAEMNQSIGPSFHSSMKERNTMGNRTTLPGEESEHKFYGPSIGNEDITPKNYSTPGKTSHVIDYTMRRRCGESIGSNMPVTPNHGYLEQSSHKYARTGKRKQSSNNFDSEITQEAFTRRARDIDRSGSIYSKNINYRDREEELSSQENDYIQEQGLQRESNFCPFETFERRRSAQMQNNYNNFSGLTPQESYPSSKRAKPSHSRMQSSFLHSPNKHHWEMAERHTKKSSGRYIQDSHRLAPGGRSLNASVMSKKKGNSLTRKDVVDILKLHKALQQKIQYLEGNRPRFF